MASRGNLKSKSAISFLLLAVISGVAYQNCGQAGTEGSFSSSSIDPKLSKLPFPYDLSVNQIAYMSCPTSGSSSNAKFTFMVGAFDNGADVPSSVVGIAPAGMKLRSTFLTELDKATASYAADLKTAKLQEALVGMANVANGQPQVSIRDTQRGLRFNAYYRGTNGASQVTNFLAPMNKPEFAKSFQQNRNGVFNYFPFVSDYKVRSFQARLNIPVNADPDDEQAFRTDIQNNLMVVSFVDSAVEIAGSVGNQPFSAKDGSKNSIWGRGYQLNFSRPSRGLNLSTYPARALSSIEEFDVSADPKTSIASSCGSLTSKDCWDCSRQFKVVRLEDRYNMVHGPGAAANAAPSVPACPPELYGDQTNSADKLATLHILRRFLPAEAWDINVTNKCIVPKGNGAGCYNYTGDKIIYDETFFPTPNKSLVQNDRCGGRPIPGQLAPPDCAHYLTVCIRK